MIPIHFGSSERPLFGLYHAPTAQPARSKGVVLCNPFGDEAIKSHRAFRHLAAMLGKERFHVLRFDYFGTGDSSGSSQEGSVAQWLADIQTAADELKDMTGVTRLLWVGLRLGGTLAFLAAAKRRDLDAVVMWDPVLNGVEYLEELATTHVDYLKAEFSDGDHGRKRVSTGNEALGFPLTGKLRSELSAVDLLGGSVSCPAKSVIAVFSQHTATREAFFTHLQARGLPVQRHLVPLAGTWNSDDAINSAVVPTPILEKIVESIT